LAATSSLAKLRPASSVRLEVVDLITNDRPLADWKRFAVEADSDDLDLALEVVESFGEDLIKKPTYSGNILKYVAKKAAVEKNFSALRTSQKLLFVLGGRKVQAHHLAFKHFEAECLWLSDDLERSFHLCVDLFKKYPNRRKDVSNLAGNLFKDAVQADLGSKESESKLVVSKRIVDEVRQIFNGRYNIPALNLWRPCFGSKRFRHQSLAEEVVEENPGCVEVVHQRFPGILRQALGEGDVDLFHRMIEFTLRHGIREHVGQTLGCLLYHYCEYACMVIGIFVEWDLVCESSVSLLVSVDCGHECKRFFFFVQNRHKFFFLNFLTLVRTLQIFASLKIYY
jgi:hypothetical protein